MREIRSLILVVLALGCASPPSTSAPTDREGPAEAANTVVVERDPAGSGWIATWKLSAPTRELRFERTAGGFRAGAFEVLTPGFRMSRDGEIEILRSEGGAEREIRVRFPEFDRHLQREYEFFRRFTDGGVAIYTGHLVARPGQGDGDRPYIRTFRFVPPAGQAVVIAGKRTEGPAEWVDSIGRGTYVYIGSAEPVESDDLISVVDPGLPDWLEVRSRETLPRLFALYRDRLRVGPSVRPVVLFDYKEGSTDGYSNGGGTLPGLIQLGAEGRAWATPSEGATVQLLHFIAHEAAHVWNGEIAHYPGTEDAWMHEGSADALAERALQELGVLDEAEFLAHQTAALNECRVDLAATPLRPSASRGRPRMAYTCGNMIALLTEAVLRPGLDLFDFWATLIDRAIANDGQYDAQDYLSVWRALGADADDVDVVTAFLHETMDPLRLAAALKAAGVAIETSDPPASYGHALVRQALAHLMRADCGGRVGFRSSSGQAVLDGDLACERLPQGGRVTAFGPHDLVTEGHLAYDHVERNCGAGDPVAVRVIDVDSGARDVRIDCAGGLPPRLPYLEIVGRPAPA